MCLNIIVEIENLTRSRADEFVELIKGKELLIITVYTPSKWFRKLTPVLHISEDGGCACSMLSENADWNAETWEMNSSVLSKLANTIIEISKKLSTSFNFLALWAGDIPFKEISLSLTDLLQLIKENKIGTKIKYKIVI